MSKKCATFIIVPLVLAVVLLAVCVVLLFPNTDDTQSLDNTIHFSEQRDCFFIGGKTVQELNITGQSTFTIIGSLTDDVDRSSGEELPASIFNGHMELADYPLSLTDGFQNFTGSIGEKFITLTCQGITTVNESADVWYTVQILRADTNVCVIYVYHEDSSSSVAVCGTDEADALDNYKRYIEEFRISGS